MQPMKIISIKKTKEFISYLLDQIDRSKEDWFIENQEMQSLKNEITELKKHVDISPLVPYEIKTKIMDLKFNFDEVKQSRKQFLRNFLKHYSSAEERDSYTFKLRLDNLKNDLQNILRLIDTRK